MIVMTTEQLDEREAALRAAAAPFQAGHMIATAHDHPTTWLTDNSDVITDTMRPPTMMEDGDNRDGPDHARRSGRACAESFDFVEIRRRGPASIGNWPVSSPEP